MRRWQHFFMTFPDCFCLFCVIVTMIALTRIQRWKVLTEGSQILVLQFQFLFWHFAVTLRLAFKWIKVQLLLVYCGHLFTFIEAIVERLVIEEWIQLLQREMLYCFIDFVISARQLLVSIGVELLSPAFVATHRMMLGSIVLIIQDIQFEAIFVRPFNSVSYLLEYLFYFARMLPLNHAHSLLFLLQFTFQFYLGLVIIVCFHCQRLHQLLNFHMLS